MTTWGNIDYMRGQAETQFEIYDPYAPKGDADLGKDDFLQLLVTQMQNQDPLNPMEDKEFTAQMAQFTSLEHLQNISDGIDTLAVGDMRSSMINAADYIGKDVRAEGYNVGINNGQPSTLYYTLEEPVAASFINIYDSMGNMVRTVDLGAKSAGSYEFTWDGLDYNGDPLPDGVYATAMGAETVDGKPAFVSTDVSGTVNGVQNVGNSIYLRLDDGRLIDFMNIKEVVNPAAESESEA